MSVWKQKTIWQLVNSDGTLVTGWVQINGFWYYMDSTGTMYQDKWFQDSNGKWYYLDDNGRMVTGWQKIESKYYCFAPDGYLYVSCITPDGYEVDSNGVWNKNILSDKGADFIGGWEGFWEKAGYDPCYPGEEKYMTIGYGTTYEARPDAFPNGINSTCTIEQARQWLIEEGQEKAEAIKNDLDNRGIILPQHELDALISFAYNCGANQKGLLGSTLYKNVINGVRNSETITNNFKDWNKANGKVEAGLTRRRQGEANLFLNADYTGNN